MISKGWPLHPPILSSVCFLHCGEILQLIWKAKDLYVLKVELYVLNVLINCSTKDSECFPLVICSFIQYTFVFCLLRASEVLGEGRHHLWIQLWAGFLGTSRELMGAQWNLTFSPMLKQNWFLLFSLKLLVIASDPTCRSISARFAMAPFLPEPHPGGAPPVGIPRVYKTSSSHSREQHAEGACTT